MVTMDGLYSPVPGIQTRLQNGVGRISHYIFVIGYLDMKNHRGAFPPPRQKLRDCQIKYGRRRS